MKTSKIVTITLLMGIIAFTSCKPPPPPEPTPAESQIALLAKTWAVTIDPLSVTLDAADNTSNWTGFSLTVNSDKTYSTSGVHAGFEGVWPATGTWDFNSDTDVSTIIRDDGTVIGITVDNTTLTMSFSYVTGGRTSGTDGAWVFNMAN